MELKKCPFCGETPKVETILREPPIITVICPYCTANGAWALTEPAAIQLWNTRYQEDET